MEKTNGRHIIGTVRCRIGFSGYRLVTTGIRGLSFITLAPPYYFWRSTTRYKFRAMRYRMAN